MMSRMATMRNGVLAKGPSMAAATLRYTPSATTGMMPCAFDAMGAVDGIWTNGCCWYHARVASERRAGKRTERMVGIVFIQSLSWWNGNVVSEAILEVI